MRLLIILILLSLSFSQNKIEKELDAVWDILTRTVAAGDAEGYGSAYHEDAVLVSAYTKNSYSIKQALKEWKPGFDATKAGKMQANALFRFSQRFHNEETAHETGMFHYYTINSEGKRADQYVHMNALLVKKNGIWKIVMEYQKGPGTKEEWEALK